MDENPLARALRWGKGQFSLDPQPDQDFLSAETAADTALGFIPGVGQAMALRDMERARRANDPIAGGLAAASLIPFGRLLRAGKNQLVAGEKALNAPKGNIAQAKQELAANPHADPDEMWQRLGTAPGLEPHKPMKWEIDDSKAILKSLRSGKLEDVFDHPEFFKNYPQARNWRVNMKIDPLLKSGNNSFNVFDGTITINSPDPKQALDSMLHEIQHGIQLIEKFDPGSHPKYIKERILQELRDKGVKITPQKEALAERQAWKEYEVKGGELEANIVPDRRDYNKQQRRELSPMRHIEEAGYPRETQIFSDKDLPPGFASIRQGGDPELFATHASYTFDPGNVGAPSGTLALPHSFDSPSFAISRFAEGSKNEVPFAPQRHGLVLVPRPGALDPKDAPVELYNRDAYTSRRKQPVEKFGTDPTRAKEHHFENLDEDIGSAQAASVLQSPSFKSLKEFESSPYGSRLITSDSPDYDHLNAAWRKTRERFYEDVPNSRALKHLKHYASKGDTEAQSILETLRKAPSEYAEAKWRGKFPITNERIAGAVIMPSDIPELQHRGNLVKALKNRGIPYKDAINQDEAVDMVKFLSDSAAPYGARY